jgi:Cytochrome c554 and c-prime
MRSLLPRLILASGLLALSASESPAQEQLTAYVRQPDLLVPPGPDAVQPPSRSAELAELRYVGAGSCAASNCHGNPETRRIRGSEYTIWSLDDPHSRAFTVLYNEQSQTIARNLGLGAAHQAQVCLNCHALDATSAHIPEDDHAILTDGVSCEMCHGPAGRWLEPHRRAEWQNPAVWPRERKLATGFRDTKDVLLRTEACAACHVGAPGRDVNHDLIAAGHPRLYFEMAAYHSRMPAHWSQREDLERHGPALEARLWSVGQAVSAERAARLLAHRAGDERNPWPELAEYSCFACHHALDTPSWRQNPEREFAGGRPGGLPWGTWHFDALTSPAAHPALAGDDRLSMGRDALRTAMATFPRVPRAPIATRATALAERLAAWAVRLNEADYSVPEVERLTARLAARRDLPSGNWDAAAQLYLAVVAANQARVRSAGGVLAPSPDDAAIYAELRQMRDLLSFSTGPATTEAGSPREFGPDTTDQLGEHLQRIERLLAK